MAGKIYSVGIYARLSVEGGDRKNESIQTQIEIAKEYMKGREDMVLYGCYSDLGKTGTNFEREGFERLMTDVRHRRVDCVIVKDFSRFGRNYIETGNYIQKIFPFLGVRFVSVTDWFDSLFSDNDDIGINLKNLANEMYARDIALKVKSSKRAKRESGGYVGGIPPYGYRAEWICGKKCLFAEAGAAEVVKWIFSQYDEGRSLKEIAGNLYEQEIHRPTEYRRYNHLRRQPGEALHEWPRTSLKAILTNLVYAGCMALGDVSGGNDVLRQLQEGGLGSGGSESSRIRSGGSESSRIRSGEAESSGIRSGETGSSRIRSGEAESSGIRSNETESSGIRSGETESSRIRSDETASSGIENGDAEYKSMKENTHEAIVSREQFCRIARRFEERADKAKEREPGADKNNTKGKNPFDGVLFCGCCGKKLGRRSFVKKSCLDPGIRSCNYFCRNSNKIDDFGCSTSAVSEDVLIEMVKTVLRQEAVLNNILTEELVQENMKYARERKDKIQRDISAIQKKMKAADWAGSEQYRKYREGIIGREAFLEWKARNEKEEEKARISLEQEKSRLCEVDAGTEQQNTLLRELTSFSGKPDVELISALIQKIGLYPDRRVEITFRFTAKGSISMAEAGGGNEQEI